MPEPRPHRCPIPTTEEPAPPACCLMLIWISSRTVIAAMPPVASNLQITTNYGPDVNARGYDPLMAEPENGSSPLAPKKRRCPGSVTGGRYWWSSGQGLQSCSLLALLDADRARDPHPEVWTPSSTPTATGT